MFDVFCFGFCMKCFCVFLHADVQRDIRVWAFCLENRKRGLLVIACRALGAWWWLQDLVQLLQLGFERTVGKGLDVAGAHLIFTAFEAKSSGYRAGLAERHEDRLHSG